LLDELSPNNFNDFERENEFKNEGNTLPTGLTTVTSVTDPKPEISQKQTCPKCGEEFEPYWFKHHHCEGTD
jgi:hypothetical protein